MTDDLSRLVAVLERTPHVVRTWLVGLPEFWTHARYGPETFSPYHVVGHLIRGEESDWMPRIERILEHGESLPFDPFPHAATIEPEVGGPLESLVERFAVLRAANLGLLKSLELDEPALARRGRHPALGAVTLRQLLHTWTTHDIHHLGQIAKAMAWQEREAVGPWRAYMNILPKES